MTIVTSPTLLKKMQNITDQESWDRFYGSYAPMIIGYCRKRSLSNEMALDVLQETMVRLLRLIPNFHYDPAKGKFRSFLFKIVDGKRIDAIKRQGRYCTFQSDSKEDWVKDIEDSKVKMPCKDWDYLWEKNVLLQAIDRVQERVDPLTYDSFKSYVLEKKSIEEVCKILREKYDTNVNKNLIYQHKARIIKLLKQIVENLKKEIGE